MLLCYGRGKIPIEMDSSVKYDVAGLANKCGSIVENGAIIYIMHHPGVYSVIKSPIALTMACEMLVDYNYSISESPPTNDEESMEDFLDWLDPEDQDDFLLGLGSECDSGETAMEIVPLEYDMPGISVPVRNRYNFGDESDRPFSSIPLWGCAGLAQTS